MGVRYSKGHRRKAVLVDATAACTGILEIKWCSKKASGHQSSEVVVTGSFFTWLTSLSWCTGSQQRKKATFKNHRRTSNN